jgi:DDE domain
VRFNGQRRYLWRVVDHEGEVSEPFVNTTRDKTGALKFLKKALKRHGRTEAIVTGRLPFYRAAMKALRCEARRQVGRWVGDRAENSHLPFRRRERAMLRFRRMETLQRFVSSCASLHKHLASPPFGEKLRLHSTHQRDALSIDGWRQILYIIIISLATSSSLNWPTSSLEVAAAQRSCSTQAARSPKRVRPEIGGRLCAPYRSTAWRVAPG